MNSESIRALHPEYEVTNPNHARFESAMLRLRDALKTELTSLVVNLFMHQGFAEIKLYNEETYRQFMDEQSYAQIPTRYLLRCSWYRKPDKSPEHTIMLTAHCYGNADEGHGFKSANVDNDEEISAIARFVSHQIMLGRI